MHFSNRVYDPLVHSHLIPIIPLYDMESAFPSIIHKWIFMVLRYRKLPEGYLRLFSAIYRNARAVETHNGKKLVVIQFLSGVLQGCPASAFLFNNAMDPFFRDLDKHLTERKAGIIRACADDLGAALRALKFLIGLPPIFSTAQDLAGLTLKPSKCHLVILSEFSNDIQKGN